MMGGLEPAMALQIGTRIGPYEIVSPLGAGGMGEVYRARDVRLDRDVALKRLPPGVGADPASSARFDREARSLAALSHPNIVTIYSVETVGTERVLAMELIDGRPLDRCVPPGGVPLAQFFALAVPLADAMAAAHDRGVTHRDLKPANIIVRPDGRPTIVDFGLARLMPSRVTDADTETALTTPGAVMGTPHYMAPEQATGGITDERADVFSLGAIYYELLTGARAFSGSTVAGVLASLLRDQPAPLRRPDVPDAVRRLVFRCMDKDPRRRFQSVRDLREALEVARAPHESPRTTERSVGVLPLKNLSGQAAEDYFADGMTEALITDLAKIRGLRVISRGSVMQFKDTTQALPDIGRALGVDALVEGSILRNGDRVRISARLMRTDTEEYAWAERYDRDLADVLTLQDEVARAIARAVDDTLRGGPGPTRKVDPEVYLLALQARHHFHERTEAGFRAAFRDFETAVARDATYAPAHLGMAESLCMLANYGIVPPSEILPPARAAIGRAIDLEPDSADAHRVLAFLHWQFEFNWQAAIDAYERALALDPNSAAVTYWYGAYLGVIGRFERSHDLLARARDLDPLSLVVPSVQGWTRFWARRFEAALTFFTRVLDIDPNYHLALWFQGEALVELGRFDEGLASLERAYDGGGHTARLLGYLGYAYGRAGRTDRAAQALAELDARGRERYVPPYFPALVLNGLGRDAEAVERLEDAFRIGDTMLRDLRADAQWDRLRPFPPFQALLARMAYPDPD